MHTTAASISALIIFVHSAQSPSDPVVIQAVQMGGLKPPLIGVHLSPTPEYMPLQHPFMNWEFEGHCAQSPSDPDVGGMGVDPPEHLLLILNKCMVRYEFFNTI